MYLELFGHNSNEDEELIKSLDNGSTLTQFILEAQNDKFFMERSTNCDNSSLVETHKMVCLDIKLLICIIIYCQL